MNRSLILIGAIGIIVLLVFSGAFFTVREDEQAIVIQFGKPVGSLKTTAGLYMKIPIIQDVIKFDRRILEWDGEETEIPTRDNKFIFIDAFARWRISDPLKFFKSAKNELLAQSRLDGIIDGSVRDEISNRVMAEIIQYSNRKMTTHDISTLDPTMVSDTQAVDLELGGARLEIVQNILESVSSELTFQDMGMEVIDIQLKRIIYNQEVIGKLFDRMKSDQYRIAEKYKAQGQGEKQKIMGMVVQRKKEILSDAYLRSQTIKGNADGQAVKIYADSYNQSPDFYNFLKTLETYEQTLDSTTTVILSTDNQYLKYLEKK